MTVLTQQEQKGLAESSILTRYAKMDKEDFRSELDKAWKAIEDVSRVVIDHVENGNLRPIDGIRAMSCLSGSAFGYEEFHPRSGQSQYPTVLTSGTDS